MHLKDRDFIGKPREPFPVIPWPEWGKTVLMTVYFFLTIAIIYVLKPVQRSLFISEYGADKLSWAYMGEGPFLILVTWLYLQFAKMTAKKTFYQGTIFFFAIVLTGFWFFLNHHLAHTSCLFYLWHAALSIMLTTVFWTFANDLYSTMNAKRLFGFILAGGSLGGIAGGSIAKHLVAWMSTENLVLVAAGIMMLCLILVRLLCHLYLKDPNGVSQEANALRGESPEKEASSKSALKLFFNSRYLLLLCAIVVCAKICAAFTDNQLSVVAAQHIHDKEALTKFFGGFFEQLNTVSFVMQFIVTSIILRYLGVGVALYLLPIGLLILGFFNGLTPTLLGAVILRLFEGGTTVSVQQATKEVLYLPISSFVRRRTKPLIDMLGYRMAKSLGGLMITVALSFFHLSSDRVIWLILLIVPFWLVVIWKMLRAYQVNLRETAEKNQNNESFCLQLK